MPKIEVEFIWSDDGCAKIECSECKKEILIVDYETRKCSCGAEFKLHQRIWVTKE